MMDHSGCGINLDREWPLEKKRNQYHEMTVIAVGYSRELVQLILAQPDG